MIIYLDDILIMHQSREELILLILLVYRMFQALGLMVNMEKSQLTPKQEMEFLGFLMNSVSLHLAFPTEKMRKIQQDAQSLIQQKLVSIRDWPDLLGKPLPQQEPFGKLPCTTGLYRIQ